MFILLAFLESPAMDIIVSCLLVHMHWWNSSKKTYLCLVTIAMLSVVNAIKIRLYYQFNNLINVIDLILTPPYIILKQTMQVPNVALLYYSMFCHKNVLLIQTHGNHWQHLRTNNSYSWSFIALFFIFSRFDLLLLVTMKLVTKPLV